MRFLIMDDSPEDRRRIRQTLQTEFQDGEFAEIEAQDQFDAILRAGGFDVALMESQMHWTTGVAATRQIRALYPAVPIIMIIFAESEAEARDSLRQGVSDYVLKEDLLSLPVIIRRRLKKVSEKPPNGAAKDRAAPPPAFKSEAAEWRPQAEILAQLNDAVVAFDNANRFTYLNPAAEEMAGMGAAEILGQARQDMFDFHFLGVDDEEQARTILDTAGCWRGEILLKKKGGEEVFLEVSACEFKNPQGAVAGFIAIAHDITLRKRLEMQSFRTQKMEELGLLTGGVAHDFNNILMAIHGYAELGERQTPPDSQVFKNLKNIQKAVTRATGLTRQLLAFVRHEPAQPQVANLNELLLDISRVLRRLISEDIELIILPKPELGQARMDRSQLEQIIVNMATNARDAMPDGGKLTIRAGNVTLDEDFARQFIDVTPGPYVVISISDTGMGIPDDVKPHIFEPLFTTKEPGKGTGLGLANCYTSVKQAGGNIRVFSEVGQGTTFNIYLPRIAEPIPEAPAREEVTLPCGTETILVVEDEPLVRDIIVRALQSLGYEIFEAANGSEALHLVDSITQKIDLLVTDVVMPQVGGKELAERMVALRPGIKVLYTSGYVDDTIILDNTLESEVGFLHKPVTTAALARKVRDMLDGRARSQP